MRLGWAAAAGALWLLAAMAGEGEIANVRLSSGVGGNSPLLSAVLAPPRTFDERAARFRELLYRGGATPEDIREEAIRGTPRGGRNISVVLPGGDPQAGVLLFGAHLDAHAHSLGAIDNWSGVVMLASLHAYCRRQALRHTLMFVGFGDEEIGLAGSEDFLARRRRKGMPPIRAMVNLECLGAGPPLVWANRSSDRLERIFQDAGRAAQAPLRRQILFGYQTDAFVFARAGIPTITIHSLSPHLLPLINSPADTPENLRLRWYRTTFRLLTEAVQLLDCCEDLTAADSERHLRPVASALLEGVRADGKTVHIHDLPRESAEWRSGLRPGDILLAIGNASVRNTAEVMNALLTCWQGCRVPLLVMRQQHMLALEVAY